MQTFKKIIGTLVFWVGLGAVSMALAQELPQTTAKAELAEYLDAMGMGKVQSEQKGNLFMHCQVRMVPRDSLKYPEQESEFRYWVSAQKVRYEDPRMQVYQDKDLIATVIPHTKSVYVGEAPKGEASGARVGHRLALRDTLWDHLQVVGVRDLCLANGRNGREFRVEVAPRARQMAGVSKATFVVDVERRQFVSVSTVHPAGHQLARTEYRYLELDLKHAAPALDGSVKKLVFAGRGRLSAQFNDFQLIELDKQ